MTSPYESSHREIDPAFPETVDDADPQDNDVPEPQEPALPGDVLLGADAVGTTAEEELLGESLDQKLDREVPEDTGSLGRAADDLVAASGGVGDEVYDTEEGRRAGRLVEPDEGAHGDTESDMIAMESDPAYDASPEEAAMHIEDGR